MRSVVLDHLDLPKYISLIYNLLGQASNNCLVGCIL